MDYDPLRRHGQINKNLSDRCVASSWESLLNVASDTLNAIQAFVITLGYQPILNVKSKLTKTPGNLAICYKRITLVPEDVMQKAGRE